MDFRFPKDEKLKSKTLIQEMFREGNAVSKYPLKLVFIQSSLPKEVTFQTGVSVSKRYFKHAVDRNKIKRFLRETYRHEKNNILNQTTDNYAFMILYTGKEMPNYDFIKQKMQQLVEKFIQNELKNR
ncbi:ribonuclease P protein component [Pustulibacterium marinum]|uniref:Ribonuclease P protein component n=1 Tax=Pustulibacterium marinum TaxID=1224947 RepID=A0A1I7ETB6_9FLAO|nr:ribonuclease P protein component [Pustulibacterium marinum]SFU27138.1 ribonuclease P protein component [Pustulibacterium marinum]